MAEKINPRTRASRDRRRRRLDDGQGGRRRSRSPRRSSGATTCVTRRSRPSSSSRFFERIADGVPQHRDTPTMRIFITGSGGAPIAPHIGAKFVQEVNAVTLAVETLHPDVGSVCELGGQDAKIIIFKKNEETGQQDRHHLDERQVRLGHRRHHRQVRHEGRPAERGGRQDRVRRLASCITSPPSAACSPRPTSSTW